MDTRNEDAERAVPPVAPPRRRSITSPAELAAHLGRDLSALAADDDGWTDLHYAGALGCPAVVWALLSDGAPANARLRTDGAHLGPQLLDTLRRCGQQRFNRWRRTGTTPLHVAVIAEAGEVVAALLEGGANPDTADAESATPLHYAAVLDRRSVAVALAVGGASVGLRNASGRTPTSLGRDKRCGVGNDHVAGPWGQPPRGRRGWRDPVALGGSGGRRRSGTVVAGPWGERARDGRCGLNAPAPGSGARCGADRDGAALPRSERPCPVSRRGPDAAALGGAVERRLGHEGAAGSRGEHPGGGRPRPWPDAVGLRCRGRCRAGDQSPAGPRSGHARGGRDGPDAFALDGGDRCGGGGESLAGPRGKRPCAGGRRLDPGARCGAAARLEGGGRVAGARSRHQGHGRRRHLTSRTRDRRRRIEAHATDDGPNRRPTASSVPNSSVAAAALITATRGASPSSRGSKPRPAQQPDLHRVEAAGGHRHHVPPRPAPDCSSTWPGFIHTLPPSSAVCAMVTARAPVSARTRSPMRAYSATDSSGA